MLLKLRDYQVTIGYYNCKVIYVSEGNHNIVLEFQGRAIRREEEIGGIQKNERSEINCPYLQMTKCYL